MFEMLQTTCPPVPLILSFFCFTVLIGLWVGFVYFGIGSIYLYWHFYSTLDRSCITFVAMKYEMRSRERDNLTVYLK